MPLLFEKAAISFGKGTMIKGGNWDSLARGGKVCREEYFQTNDSDPVMGCA